MPEIVDKEKTDRQTKTVETICTDKLITPSAYSYDCVINHLEFLVLVIIITCNMYSCVPIKSYLFASLIYRTMK